jgi:hypothetical protein
VFWGKDFKMPAGDFIPYDETSIPPDWEVVSPDIFLESVTMDEDDSIESEEERRKITESSQLVHIPFCEVVYSLFGKHYIATIDINTEQVLADSVPPSAGVAISSALCTTAICLFLLYCILGLIVPGGMARFMAYVLFSVPAYYVVDSILRKWKA